MKKDIRTNYRKRYTGSRFNHKLYKLFNEPEIVKVNTAGRQVELARTPPQNAGTGHLHEASVP
jgi:hypothetical protein